MGQRLLMIQLLGALSLSCATVVKDTSSIGQQRAAYIPPERLEADPLTTKDIRLAVGGGAEVASFEQAQTVVKGQREVPLVRDAGVAVPLPPVAASSEAKVTEATEDSEVIERRWLMHLRAYCSASFAGGLTVGVVGTLLLLSLGSDRLPVKLAKTGADPERVQVAEGSNRGERCTDSVESIHRFGPRCGFLIGMLLVQSLSSLMLAGFQDLIERHPSIIFFLTMVVGTGGNVGGQSVVLAVRRLAYGEEVSLSEQVAVGVQLSAVLAPLALLRAYAQGTKLSVCLTIGLATMLIVVLAAALGTALPKLLNRVKVDPAHATPVIQVLMDMVGVLVTCVIGYVVLDVMLKVN